MGQPSDPFHPTIVFILDPFFLRPGRSFESDLPRGMPGGRLHTFRRRSVLHFFLSGLRPKRQHRRPVDRALPGLQSNMHELPAKLPPDNTVPGPIRECVHNMHSQHGQPCKRLQQHVRAVLSFRLLEPLVLANADGRSTTSDSHNPGDKEAVGVRLPEH